jgi:hypothetical protein
MSLNKIIEIGSILALLTCAGVRNRMVVPVYGAIDRKAEYTVNCYDKNKNGLCDGYEIIGPGMMPGIIQLDEDEEMTATNLINLLKKQGLKVSYSTKFY